MLSRNSCVLETWICILNFLVCLISDTLDPFSPPPSPLPPCSGTVYGVIYEVDNAKNRSEPLRGMTAHALLLYQNRLVVSRSD